VTSPGGISMWEHRHGHGKLISMPSMSQEQWREFARFGTRTGKLATVRANGLPHVVPVWFLLEEVDGHDEIVFNTGATSVKAKALRRDPRCTICVDDENPPYAFVMFEAEARLSDDLDEMLPIATRIGGRYMGEELAETYGRRNAVEGELLVRARITKVIAQSGVAN
jgi:PPOX class probable F420-dependent enzyme